MTAVRTASPPETLQWLSPAPLWNDALVGPVVIGASRKAFIGHLTGRDAGPERVVGSLAAVAAAFRGRASVVRVHDVRDTVDFLRVITAIEEKERR